MITLQLGRVRLDLVPEAGGSVARLTIDGRDILRSAPLSVELTADDTLSFLHVYAPLGESFFCAEPVSAVPDAFNRSESLNVTGMRTLRTDESATAWMELRVLQR